MTELLRELEAVVGLLETKAMLSREGEGCAADSYLRRYEYAAAEYIRTHHAEIAEALKDARRYRSLKDRLDGDLIGGFDVTVTRMENLTEWIYEGDDLDAAIDAHNSAREVGE